MQLTATTNQARISSFEIHLATLPVFFHIMSCAVEVKNGKNPFGSLFIEAIMIYNSQSSEL